MDEQQVVLAVDASSLCGEPHRFHGLDDLLLGRCKQFALSGPTFSMAVLDGDALLPATMKRRLSTAVGGQQHRAQSRSPVPNQAPLTLVKRVGRRKDHVT